MKYFTCIRPSDRETHHPLKEVLQIVEAFNSHWRSCFLPGYIVCMDESTMSSHSPKGRMQERLISSIKFINRTSISITTLNDRVCYSSIHNIIMCTKNDVIKSLHARNGSRVRFMVFGAPNQKPHSIYKPNSQCVQITAPALYVHSAYDVLKSEQNSHIYVEQTRFVRRTNNEHRTLFLWLRC